MPQDWFLFLRALAQNPRSVSSLVPSSRALARAMAEGLGAGSGRVAEFGPGTGAVTKALLAQGIAPENLTLFELDPGLCAHLRRRFPDLRVENRPAQEARDVLAPGLGAVVSSLPLLSLPAPISAAILDSAFRLLAPGAPFIQFTYGRRPSVPAPLQKALGLAVEERAFVWRNLPPARVHVFRQKALTPSV